MREDICLTRINYHYKYVIAEIMLRMSCIVFFFFQAEDGIRDLVRSRGLGDVYKRQLHTLREDLAGDVVFMFQPAEEGPGGAEPMINEGALEAAGRRADTAYALHVISSEHPRGVWGGRPGPKTVPFTHLRLPPGDQV